MEQMHIEIVNSLSSFSWVEEICLSYFDTGVAPKIPVSIATRELFAKPQNPLLKLNCVIKSL